MYLITMLFVFSGVTRQFGSKASSGPYRVARPLLLGAVAAGAGIYMTKKYYGTHVNSVIEGALGPVVQSVSAAALPESQPSVSINIGLLQLLTHLRA